MSQLDETDLLRHELALMRFRAEVYLTQINNLIGIAGRKEGKKPEEYLALMQAAKIVAFDKAFVRTMTFSSPGALLDMAKEPFAQGFEYDSFEEWYRHHRPEHIREIRNTDDLASAALDALLHERR